MNFDEAFERIIGHEGGLVDNPADKGGLTKFGISQRSYPGLDIKALTVDDAKAIYRRDYWDRVQASKYDGAIGFQLFDAAVNSGISAAVKMLQRAVGVADDGAVGPQTLNAIAAQKVPKILMRFNAERLQYMTDTGSWQTFSRGWARRIVANLNYAAGDM